MQFLNLLTLAAIASATPLAAAAAAAPADSGLIAPVVTKVPLSAARIAELEASVANGTHVAGTLVDRAGQCTWTAYSGDLCNVQGGGIVAINSAPSCIRTQDRHSFYVSQACPKLNTLFFTKLLCNGRYSGQVYGPGCYHVNTGFNWASSFVSKV